MEYSAIPGFLRNPSEIKDLEKYQNRVHQEQVYNLEEEDDDGALEEETLSLSDLPVNTKVANQHNILQDDPSKSHMPSFSSPPSSSSGASEFFEFFSSFSSDMCPADDIILFGKLIPLNDKLLASSMDQRKSHIKPDPRENLDSPQSDQLVPKLQTTVKRSYSDRTGGSGTPTPQLVKHSRSLDYREPSGSSGLSVSQSLENIDRNLSSKSIGKRSDTALSKMACKPRWYLLFGSVKVPAEMEINEMKKRRQLRRDHSMPFMFPAKDPDGKFPVNQSKSGDVFWTRVMKALCCKDPNSVAVVTTSPSII